MGLRLVTPIATAFLLLSRLVLPRGSWGQERPPSASDFQPGAIAGVVRLGGTGIPSPTRVTNTTDPEVCGRTHALDDLVVSPGNKGIRYVVAALTDVPPEHIPAHRPTRVTVDNRDCRFEPHAAVALVGDTIVAVNDDATLHTTHFYGPLRANISLPVEGMTVARVVRRAGMISVLCDVHGWMKAFIRVDEHPFHSVSDEDGRFRIAGVPPGRYRIELWHEVLGVQHVEVTVQAGRTSRVEVVYPRDEKNSSPS